MGWSGVYIHYKAMWNLPFFDLVLILRAIDRCFFVFK